MDLYFLKLEEENNPKSSHLATSVIHYNAYTHKHTHTYIIHTQIDYVCVCVCARAHT